MNLSLSEYKTELDIIRDYVQLVLKEFDLDENELVRIWTTAHPENRSFQQQPVGAKYTKMRKAELQALCKERGLRAVGTKSILIDRLEGRLTDDPKTAPKKKRNPKKKSIADVLMKLQDSKTATNLRRNEHGNYEHKDTGFVFNEKTCSVIGKQNGEVVDPLSESDIEKCRELKFQYEIPISIQPE